MHGYFVHKNDNDNGAQPKDVHENFVSFHLLGDLIAVNILFEERHLRWHPKKKTIPTMKNWRILRVNFCQLLFRTVGLCKRASFDSL